MSAPVPFLFLWTLDFGFWIWIWDLDLGLGFGTGLGLDNYHFLYSGQISLFHKLFRWLEVIKVYFHFPKLHFGNLNYSHLRMRSSLTLSSVKLIVMSYFGPNYQVSGQEEEEQSPNYCNNLQYYYNQNGKSLQKLYCCVLLCD